MAPGEEGELSCSIGSLSAVHPTQDLICTAPADDLPTTFNQLRMIKCTFPVESVPSLETTDKGLICRGIAPWVVFFLIVLVQGCPFLVFLWAQTCSVDDTEEFIKVMVVWLPVHLATWFVGCCFAYFLDHWERSRRISRVHFWTGVYLTTALVSTAFYSSYGLIGYCNPSRSLYLIYIFGNIPGLSLIASWVILAWLLVLKLRIAAPMAPKAERIGSAFAKVFFFIAPLCYLSNAFDSYVLVVVNPLTFLLVVTLSGCVVFAMEVSARAMTEEATRLDIDVETAAKLLQASRMARCCAVTIAVSGLTTSTVLIEAVVSKVFDQTPNWNLPFALDFVSNAAACITLSGLWDGTLDSSVSIRWGVYLIEAERFRQIERKICGTIGASTGSALVISALTGNARPLEVLKRGMDRFRCIRWEVLRQRPDIIMGGAPLDVLGPGKDDLYSLSEPCRLGDCDTFFSHSWHDSGTVKWQALCCWCDEFKMVHGRFPRLWLDKVCIDQASIDVDLQCLPVFLAGCNSLFAAGGSTYHTRLWCVMELLIYREMLINDPKRSNPVVWAIGNEPHEIQLIREGWVNIDVRKCECYMAEDKEQFMRVVGAFPGGIDRFNIFMQNVGQTVDRDYIQDYDEVLVI